MEIETIVEEKVKVASFELECGETLKEAEILYHTFGTLNKDKNNVIWICHALTANSNPLDWWANIVGEGHIIDPLKHFIVCTNMLGSCYGSTGPASINPETGEPYLNNFPLLTMRDIVKGHQLVQKELKINQIHLAIGGSMGAQQILEWSIMDPNLIEHSCLIASNAKHSPWGIAFNAAQVMAIEADQTYYNGTTEGGKKGLEAARAIAMISYRNYEIFEATQRDNDEKLEGFKATSYQQHQGKKLSDRFSAHSYVTLRKTMDAHDVGRGRESLQNALSQVKTKTLVINITSDILFPIADQQLIAEHISNSELKIIDSAYGHDGFLIEGEGVSKLVSNFLGHYSPPSII